MFQQNKTQIHANCINIEVDASFVEAFAQTRASRFPHKPTETVLIRTFASLARIHPSCVFTRFYLFPFFPIKEEKVFVGNVLFYSARSQTGRKNQQVLMKVRPFSYLELNMIKLLVAWLLKKKG